MNFMEKQIEASRRAIAENILKSADAVLEALHDPELQKQYTAIRKARTELAHLSDSEILAESLKLWTQIKHDPYFGQSMIGIIAEELATADSLELDSSPESLAAQARIKANHPDLMDKVEKLSETTN